MGFLMLKNIMEYIKDKKETKIEIISKSCGWMRSKETMGSHFKLMTCRQCCSLRILLRLHTALIQV
jgi:arginyl-tRNA--protein-N-Asp/Glu arginylyltransferase